MQTARGGNNAQSVFGIQEIPSDNQIRGMLDPVPPQALYPVYDRVYEALRQEGILQSFQKKSGALNSGQGDGGTWKCVPLFISVYSVVHYCPDLFPLQ